MALLKNTLPYGIRHFYSCRQPRNVEVGTCYGLFECNANLVHYDGCHFLRHASTAIPARVGNANIRFETSSIRRQRTGGGGYAGREGRLIRGGARREVGGGFFILFIL